MTEGEKCGLSSIIPMSCRGKAEAFARKLHSRLRSLGSEDGNGSADESSWLAANENPIALSQPRHGADSDIYFDFGLLESPGSPEDELDVNELHKLLNSNRFKLNNECQCSKTNNKNLHNGRSNSVESDDGPFYDTENFVTEEKVCNGDINSESSKSYDNETGIDVNSEEISSNQEESFVTTSECTPQPSVSLSDDLSTLSLKDEEEYPSLEVNSIHADVFDSSNEITYNSCNGTATLVDTHNDAEIKHLEISEINGKNEGADIKELNGEQEIVLEEKSVIRPVVIIKEDEEESDNKTESDEFENDERTPRVRRCSSLKTGKTPPGTPGRKKIVRFADALGLDLAECRTFLDEIPKVPISAYEDLSVDLSDSSDPQLPIAEINPFNGIKVDKILMPLFQQPGGLITFLDKVRDNQVCLESAVVEDPVLFTIKGIVRVRNLDFHKSVHIRYTLNSWKTYADVKANYVDNSCDGFSDKFSFTLYCHSLTVGQRLEFACRFQSKGCQYWDNNNGVNYCFQCLPATNHSSQSPITHVNDWGASFYY